MNKNRYVIAVGWDKRINIYSDSPDENIHHVQYPLPKWPDDEVITQQQMATSGCSAHSTRPLADPSDIIV